MVLMVLLPISPRILVPRGTGHILSGHQALAPKANSGFGTLLLREKCGENKELKGVPLPARILQQARQLYDEISAKDDEASTFSRFATRTSNLYHFTSEFLKEGKW